MSTVDFLGMGVERPEPAPEIEPKPKPRRGNAHPDFVPKDDLRRQLEVKDAEIAWQKAARVSERRTFAVAFAFVLLLFVADVGYHLVVKGGLP